MRRNRSLNKTSHGFSLIELAIVLLFGGLIVTAALQAFKIYTQSQIESLTDESIEAVQDAMTKYVSLIGRYPCPADPALAPGDLLYGESRLAAGTCDDAGDIVETLGRDADTDGTDDPIFIGAVPFNTIVNDICSIVDPDIDTDFQCAETERIFQERHMYDGWGNKITYAVTGALTDATTFRDNLGAISLEDEHRNSIVEPEGSAHMVIVSHGENGRGGYNIEGNQLTDDCGASVVLTPAQIAAELLTPNDETDNCDQDDLFVSGLANEGADYFDDIVQYKIYSASSLWTLIEADEIINNNPGNIGIGTKVPQADLHVVGDVLAIDLFSDTLCGPGGTGDDCMEARFLGGPAIDEDNTLPNDCTDPALLGNASIKNSCGPNEVVVAICHNRVICRNPFAGVSPLGNCAAGTYLVGITSSGGLICETP